MLAAYRQNTLFLDATEGDADELLAMRERYESAGRFQKGEEAAMAEFIMRVAEQGVPGGGYLSDKPEEVDFWLLNYGVPRIKRP